MTEMKKFVNIIAVVLSVAVAASCSMFQLDNFEGPDAKVSGRLVDAETGELIGVEAAFSQEIDWANVDWATWTFPMITVSKGSLVVNELGWKDKEGKTYQNGTKVPKAADLDLTAEITQKINGGATSEDWQYKDYFNNN